MINWILGDSFSVSHNQVMTFFISGVRNALLSSDGKSAQESDVFVISVRTGTSWSLHCFNSQVGMGSNAHDLVGDVFMIFLTSSCETVLNSDSGSPLNCRLESK